MRILRYCNPNGLGMRQLKYFYSSGFAIDIGVVFTSTPYNENNPRVIVQ